jgi:hypothetical protein
MGYNLSSGDSLLIWFVEREGHFLLAGVNYSNSIQTPCPSSSSSH